MQEDSEHINSIFDRLEILNLFGRYSSLIDNDQFEAFILLFDEDLHLTFDQAGNDTYVVHGREGFRQAEIELKEQLAGRNIFRRHYVTNVAVIEQQQDWAKVTAHMLITETKPGEQSKVYVTGFYQGRLIKRAENWLIKDWFITVDSEGDAWED